MYFFPLFWFIYAIPTWETKVEPKIPPVSLRLTRDGSFLLHVQDISNCYRMRVNRLAPGS